MAAHGPAPARRPKDDHITLHISATQPPERRDVDRAIAAAGCGPVTKLGLLYRLASNRQSPKIRLMIDAEKGPERRIGNVIGNVIGEIKGSTLPNEYVRVSAYFDSFTGGSGATNNGTGSLGMIEATRPDSTRRS